MFDGSKQPRLAAEVLMPQGESKCLNYSNVANYCFSDYQYLKFYKSQFTADDYVEYTGTHCDHIALIEPHRTKFYESIRSSIKNAS